MAPLPPPQGMSETDYETIEAAVTETVRGRWFLGEFARRNRTAELRQLLDAMARLESAVSAGAPALPPADPSIRLLMQRIKEIAAQLDTVSGEMRDAGVDPRFPEAVDHQARAVAGMLRGPGRGALPSTSEPSPKFGPSPKSEPARVEARRPPPQIPAAPSEPLAYEAAPPRPPVRMPRAELPASLTRSAGETDADDPRLAAMSSLDGLTLAQKLALFS